jgi:hypothetical protein
LIKRARRGSNPQPPDRQSGITADAPLKNQPILNSGPEPKQKPSGTGIDSQIVEALRELLSRIDLGELLKPAIAELLEKHRRENPPLTVESTHHLAADAMRQ